jgi:hypothetical protein
LYSICNLRISLCIAALTIVSLAHAQLPATSIAGTVKDTTGSAIPGASVTVTSSSGRTNTAVTNDQGEYAILGLRPDVYSVAIREEMFSSFRKDGLTLSEGQSLTVDAILGVAGVAASVDVAGAKTTQVETESAEVSGTITQKEVVSLGLNGRNFTQLIALAPGVSNQTGQDEAKVGVLGSVKYSVNGGRVEYNTFDVDGADLLNVGINGANSTLIVYPSVDAIQEVRVLTSNYGAMYGKTASGTVLVTTKSGTSQFHGNLYEFVRNEDFNARNFFDETKGAPLYRRNDFGGTIGGPVFIPNHYNTKREKTFFFFSEEYRTEKSPFQYNQAVPSMAERSGDFSDVCPPTSASGSIAVFSRSKYPDCPASGFNPQGLFFTFPSNQINNYYSLLNRNAVAILNTGVIPAPNSTSGCNSTIGSCYDTTVSPPTHWREDLLRVDHYFTERTRFLFRYIHDSWNTVVTTPQWGSVINSFPTIENNFTGPGTTIVGRITQTLSPSLLNDIIFSYTNSNITLSDTNGPGATWQRPSALDTPGCETETNAVGASGVQCPMGYIFNNGFGGKMPGIVIAGNNQEYGGNGFSVDAGYMPWRHTNPTYTFGDSMSKILGSHNFQFGSQAIFYLRDQTNNAIGAATGDVQGILTFSNVASAYSTGNAFADFLKQDPGTAGGAIQSYTQDSAQLEYKQRYAIAEPYFQDDWKVNSGLTVNLGLRLSLFGTYHTANNNVYNFVPGAFNQALASTVEVSNYTGALYSTQLTAAGNLTPIPLNLSNLDPVITNGLVHCGTNGVPSSCMQGHLFNYAPRIGFAWDPFGTGKTSIRSGYGIFYEHGAGNEANTGSLEASSPLVLNMTQNFPYGWGCIGGVASSYCAPSAAFPANVTSIPTKALWPYVQQWSFSIQRDLPWSTVASFAYVGSKGTHLTDELQINQLPSLPASENPFSPGEPFIPTITPPASGNPTGDCSSYTGSAFTLTNGTVVNQGQPAFNNLLAACYGQPGLEGGVNPNNLRQYLGLGRIVSLQNSADSSYNAFQFTLRRTEGPLTLGLAYSYSHSLDDSSDRSDAAFVNSYNLRGNWASSDFDQRNLLNISYVYDLNFLKVFGYTIYGAGGTPRNPSRIARIIGTNWQLSGITTYQSGTPFSVINDGGAGVYLGGISVPDNAGVANGSGLASYPDIVGNPYAPVPAGGNNGRSFGPLLLNPGAFAAPTGLTFGDAGRNALNNPNLLNFNVALLKHFQISEKSLLEFRAEAFNVFNHTEFRIYDSNMGNTGTNTVSCYGGPESGYSAAGGDGVNCLTGSAFLHPVDAHRPRTIQLGLKLSF